MTTKPAIDYKPLVHEPIDYSLLPKVMQGHVADYVERGHRVGGFLTAVFADSLVDSLGAADLENRARIFEFAQFLWNEAPTPCWGSKAKVEAWIERGGLAGRPELVKVEHEQGVPSARINGYDPTTGGYP